jgi:hypothetical protein
LTNVVEVAARDFADTFAVIRSRDTPIMRVWVFTETGDTEPIDVSLGER